MFLEELLRLPAGGGPAVLQLSAGEGRRRRLVFDEVEEAAQGLQGMAGRHVAALIGLVLRLAHAQDRARDAVRQARLGPCDRPRISTRPIVLRSLAILGTARPLRGLSLA